MTLRTLLWLAALLSTALGCGGAPAFRLTSVDNNSAQLAQAMAIREAPAAGKPVNATGEPLAFLVARANKKKNISQKLIAFDLRQKKELWEIDTDVRSRVLVGGEFIAHVNGEGKLVGRDIRTGAQRWARSVSVFLGAAADKERVYYVEQEAKGRKSKWWLVAVRGSNGKELWRLEAPGLLGTPAAQGGLVFLPFLKQWLVVLNAKTGEQMARILSLQEEISFVRATPKDVYFGSKAGVFLMDQRAASGKREESTYGRAAFPPEFSRSVYYWDAFDAIQAGYSAYDRSRILWRGNVKGKELGFQDDQVVLFTYRFFFAFDAASGQLKWAYNHPRIDVVGASHEGEVIAFASGLGEIGALDPLTGKRRYAASVPDQLIGVTFDADGWKPEEEGERSSTVGALTSIARDRDARFNAIKRFALAALATLPGAEVTRDLVDMILNERTPPKVYETAVEVLIQRKEPAGLEYLLSALNVPYNFLSSTRPRAAGVMARAIGALAVNAELSPEQRSAAIEGLIAKLHAPEISASELADVVAALGQVGGGTVELAPLSSFLLSYRSDPEFTTQIAPLSAAVDVLLRKGGAAERELVTFVAEDPRTQKSVSEYARRALAEVSAGATQAAAAPSP